MAKTKNDDIDPLLRKYPPPARSIARALFAVAKSSLPGADIAVHLGWRNVTFCYGGMRKCVCAIGPYNQYVNLYLIPGVRLKDPEHLLEGKGKKMRHVKVRSVAGARHPAIRRMIRDAAILVRQG
jgi:hypothetical protein